MERSEVSFNGFQIFLIHSNHNKLGIRVSQLMLSDLCWNERVFLWIVWQMLRWRLILTLKVIHRLRLVINLESFILAELGISEGLQHSSPARQRLEPDILMPAARDRCRQRSADLPTKRSRWQRHIGEATPGGRNTNYVSLIWLVGCLSNSAWRGRSPPVAE